MEKGTFIALEGIDGSGPDMHEAIITEQEFLLASEVIKNNGQQKGKKHNRKEESVLLGKLRCGHCKRSLVRLRRKSTPCFICKKSAYEQGSRCISERLSEPELEAAVLERINQELGQEILVRKNQKSEAVFSTMDNRSSKQIGRAHV